LQPIFEAFFSGQANQYRCSKDMKMGMIDFWLLDNDWLNDQSDGLMFFAAADNEDHPGQ
jgi:hypothetical protein